MIAKQASPLVQDVIEKYFEDNQDILKEMIKNQITTSISDIFQATIGSLLMGAMQSVQNSAEQATLMAMKNHNDYHHNGMQTY